MSEPSPDPAAVAATALDALDTPGQALVVLRSDSTIHAEVTAVVDGRSAAAVARSPSPDDLARAARQAGLQARRMRALPAPPLPGPGAAPAPASAGAGAALAGPGEGCAWTTVAVASSTGLRTTETLHHALATAAADRPDGRRATAVRLAPLPHPDLAANAAAEVDALLGEGPAPDGLTLVVPDRLADPSGLERPPVLLGPAAVAALLDALRPVFGVDAALGDARTGRRLAAPGVRLVDDAAHPGTLPRAADVEGVARHRVVLLEDGLVVGAVRDAAAAVRAGAPSTGHATRPLTLAPMPEHLVLASPSADGLYLPALVRAGNAFDAPGAALLRAGRAVGGLPALRVGVDPVTALRSLVGITSDRRCVSLRGHAPGGPGAAVVGALAATDGVRVEHGASR